MSSMLFSARDDVDEKDMKCEDGLILWGLRGEIGYRCKVGARSINNDRTVRHLIKNENTISVA